MLKRKLGLMLAGAVLFGAAFSGCKWVDTSGIDWTDYSDCSIKVKNSSKYNVVCFKGEATPETLISGAKSGTVTGLKNDTSLFSSSSDFVLYVYKEEDYVNCVDLKDIKDSPMCRIYAYYNADSNSRSNNVYEISSALGGENYFQVNNTTNYNCEIRKDGLYGEPFCYAGKQTLKTIIYAEAGDYDFYPVFRKYDKNAGAILTSYPKTAKGNPVYVAVGLGGTDNSILLDCSKYIGGTDFTMTASSAFITINNASNSGVKLYEGAYSTAETTDTGVQTINGGKYASFTVKMNQVSSGESGTAYETERTIGGWYVGPEANRISIPTITLKAGYRYILNVLGTDYDDLSCAWVVDSETGDYKCYQITLDE